MSDDDVEMDSTFKPRRTGFLATDHIMEYHKKDEDENLQLILDADDYDMEIDELVLNNNGTRPSTVTMTSPTSTPATNTSTSNSYKFDVEDDGLNAKIKPIGDHVTADDGRLIRLVAPTFPENGESNSLLVPTDINHDEPVKMKLLVPIRIVGSCVDVRVDEQTQRRAYFNHYYFQAIELTKSEEMWEKARNDSFGPDEDPAQPIEITIPSTNQVIDLYQSLNMYNQKLAIPTMENVDSQYRRDCVLIRGVAGLSTNDVFLYLRTYNQMPTKLEWINDTQCIAVFSDVYEAARCILDLSKRISKNTREKPDQFSIDSDFDLVDEVPYNWIEVSMPPSHSWRFAVATYHDAKEKPGFLLTYPKQNDKKQMHAEALSEYYREHGNPNWREIPSIWTKKGFEKKMEKKRMAMKMMKGKPAKPKHQPITRLHDPLDVDLSVKFKKARVPVRLRLGDKQIIGSSEEPSGERVGETTRAHAKRKVTLVSFESDAEEGEVSEDGNKFCKFRDDSAGYELEPRGRSHGPHQRSSYSSTSDRSYDEQPWQHTKRHWNGYRGGMVADSEEAKSRRNTHTGRSEYSGIQGRLGW